MEGDGKRGEDLRTGKTFELLPEREGGSTSALFGPIVSARASGELPSTDGEAKERRRPRITAQLAFGLRVGDGGRNDDAKLQPRPAVARVAVL